MLTINRRRSANATRPVRARANSKLPLVREAIALNSLLAKLSEGRVKVALTPSGPSLKIEDFSAPMSGDSRSLQQKVAADLVWYGQGFLDMAKRLQAGQ